MFKVSSSGSTKNVENFIKRMKNKEAFAKLDYYGKLGVEALRHATPVDTDLTAESWSYRVGKKNGKYSIIWHNSHVIEGSEIPVVILLEYGHATGTGGWVEGHDFINPAIRPIFDKIRDDVWNEVIRNA